MAAHAGPNAPGKRGALERVLSVFAEVRGGEGVPVLLLAANVFLLLCAYYIMKPVREALILAGGGAELKSYMSAGQTFLLLFTVPLYARLASRLPRRRLLNGVTLFFAACLAVFYALAHANIPLGIVFFLWIGIFNVSIIAQFWSFANDLYTPEQGKRLFAIVAFGGSAGAVVGPRVTSALIETIGPYQLLVVAGGVLLLSLVFTNAVDGMAGRRRNDASAGPAGSTPEPEEEPMGNTGAYRLVFGNRYLLSVALLILFLNWVNTTGEYILGRVVTQAAEAAAAADPSIDVARWIGKFYADFFGVVNIVGLLVQLLLVSRILKYLGVRVALLILPLIAAVGYGFAAFVPVIGIIRWAKTAENATDYSLQNTLRGVLFLPTTREEKYKAKQAIDTIFVRAGDVLSALLVFAGTQLLAFRTRDFALVNLALVVVWIVLAIRIGRDYRRLAAERGD
ncbi:MFS transporter [bacterium]|nr:MFS transporter [bacterium]